MHAPIPDGPLPWALFLDVDGTLLELAEHPDAVVVEPALPALLERLRAALDGALALVSGRTLEALDRLFAPYRFPAAGSHGAEWRLAGAVAAASADATLVPAAAWLEAFVAATPGTLLERKGHALALHYRGAPQAADAAHAAALAALARLGSGYRLLAGKAVYELLPSGVDKGRAIERFLAHPPFAGRRPVFVGDDLTDEAGFAAVNRLGGYSVRVGLPLPGGAAHAHLLSPAAVRVWLEHQVHPRLNREGGS